MGNVCLFLNLANDPVSTHTTCRQQALPLQDPEPRSGFARAGRATPHCADGESEAGEEVGTVQEEIARARPLPAGRLPPIHPPYNLPPATAPSQGSSS